MTSPPTANTSPSAHIVRHSGATQSAAGLTSLLSIMKAVQSTWRTASL